MDAQKPNAQQPRRQLSAKAQAIVDKCLREANSNFFGSARVDARSPGLTEVDRGLPNRGIRKTNPNLESATPAITAIAASQVTSHLSARQLAAARFIASGVKAADVAAKLHISRQGLWKWRRTPQFAAQTRRLHDAMVRHLGGSQY